MRIPVASILAFLVLAVGPVAAEPGRYLLQAPSNFQDGCQEGCACPVAVLSLGGTFSLTPAGREGDFEVFDVDDVAWLIAADAPGETTVLGSGTFRIRGGADPLQRLQLDLVVGDGASVHFDSGVVPVVAGFPRIDVSIARNGFFCYDHVFSLSALPQAPVAVQPSDWARIKAHYRP